MASTLPQLRTRAIGPQTAGSRNPEKLKLLHSPQRFQAAAVLRYWHLTSLDAPTVAVVWSLAFAWVAHERLTAWLFPLEVLVVWAVYVGDRLLDARRGLKLDGSGMRDRHWFHWRHRRLLVPMALIAALGAAGIALRWMPLAVWGRDSAVATASLVYFACVHAGRLRSRLFSKEMLVGVLFTAGCILPVASLRLVAPIAFFAALAWLNCWAIERWEASEKRAIVGSIAARLAFVGLALAGSSFVFAPRMALLLLAGAFAAALLATLDRLRGRMTAVSLRTLADFALLTPALVLVVARMLR